MCRNANPLFCYVTQSCRYVSRLMAVLAAGDIGPSGLKLARASAWDALKALDGLANMCYQYGFVIRACLDDGRTTARGGQPARDCRKALHEADLLYERIFLSIESLSWPLISHEAQVMSL
jgi:hypothetical protein